MLVLALVSAVVALYGAKQFLGRRERRFCMYYGAALDGVVPPVRSFRLDGTRVVRCAREPDLQLEVACDREADKIVHMRKIWRAFPALREQPFTVSKLTR